MIYVVDIESAYLHLEHLNVDAQTNFIAYFVISIKCINSVLHLPNVIGRTEIKSV